MDEYYLGQEIGRGRYYGIYESMEKVPTFGINVFDNKEYCEYYKDSQVPLFQEAIKKRPLKGLMRGFSYYFTILPIIQSIIAEKGKVNIVDFGGGQGENYIFLQRFFASDSLDYHVVEQKMNCEIGREIQFSGNIVFHENTKTDSGCYLSEEIEQLLKKADICLLIGVIILFPSYLDLLKEISKTDVKYIYITRTLMHDSLETFYSRQYVTIPDVHNKDFVVGDNRFAVINHQELINNMQSIGYSLLLDLFQQKDFSEAESLPYPYNQIEYRDMIFRLRDTKHS